MNFRFLLILLSIIMTGGIVISSGDSMNSKASRSTLRGLISPNFLDMVKSWSGEVGPKGTKLHSTDLKYDLRLLDSIRVNYQHEQVFLALVGYDRDVEFIVRSGDLSSVEEEFPLIAMIADSLMIDRNPLFLSNGDVIVIVRGVGHEFFDSHRLSGDSLTGSDLFWIFRVSPQLKATKVVADGSGRFYTRGGDILLTEASSAGSFLVQIDFKENSAGSHGSTSKMQYLALDSTARIVTTREQ